MTEINTRHNDNQTKQTDFSMLAAVPGGTPTMSTRKMSTQLDQTSSNEQIHRSPQLPSNLVEIFYSPKFDRMNNT